MKEARNGSLMPLRVILQLELGDSLLPMKMEELYKRIPFPHISKTHLKDTDGFPNRESARFVKVCKGKKSRNPMNRHPYMNGYSFHKHPPTSQHWSSHTLLPELEHCSHDFPAITVWEFIKFSSVGASSAYCATLAQSHGIPRSQ